MRSKGWICPVPIEVKLTLKQFWRAHNNNIKISSHKQEYLFVPQDFIIIFSDFSARFLHDRMLLLFAAVSIALTDICTLITIHLL